MSISMDGGDQMIAGEKRTAIPLMRDLLPLPLNENVFLLICAIMPAFLIYQFAHYPAFDRVVVVVMGLTYVVLRVLFARRYYKSSPTLEVGGSEIGLPYSHFSGDVQRVVPKEMVKEIMFYRGTGKLKNVDTYMILTDTNDRTFKISGLVIKMKPLREALENHGYECSQSPNPKRYLNPIGVFMLVMAAGYIYYMMI